MSKWKICNIDDLSYSEREQLDDFEHYRLFRGLFIINENDVETWKNRYNFDDWIIDYFPEGYIDQGRFREDLDHEYRFITDYIYNKNEKLYNKFIDVLNREHKTKDIEDIEEFLRTKLEKWDIKEFRKFDNDREKLFIWISNEICKFLR